MKEIQAGDALLVGDRCRVRGAGEGTITETPTGDRRTYKIRLETGELVEREWLLLDRLATASGRTRGGPQSEASIGKPIEWNAHPGSNGCSRRPRAKGAL